MGLKINRETNLDDLFDKFAVDPTNESNNRNKDKKNSPKGDSSKKDQ